MSQKLAALLRSPKSDKDNATAQINASVKSLDSLDEIFSSLMANPMMAEENKKALMRLKTKTEKIKSEIGKVVKAL